MADPTRVIVDCQLLQTADRDRGMGLFLFSLLKALSASKPPGLSWTFMINSNMPKLRQADEHLLQQLNGTILAVNLLHKKSQAFFAEAADYNRSQVTAAIRSLAPDLQPATATFFIPALFSAEIFPVFPEGTKNIMLFHDSIPYLYHKQYFSDPDGVALKDYAQRFSEFYKTDVFVTNSQTTADDLVVYFGVDPSRTVPILGAGASRAHLRPQAPMMAKDLGEDYVLMPSGDDLRKNNVVAAQALANLDSGIQLVVTSTFGAESRQRLTNLYPHTIFTGSVRDEEYLWLVNNAKAVLFPTLYEGLGMPVLEAVEHEATVVCSRIPVFVEISPEAFFYFDPTSPADLAQVLRETLSASPADLARKKKNYASIKKRFSWDKSAQAFLQAVVSAPPPTNAKKNLAVLCPSPASYSAVGKYIFELHAELSRFFNIDYYAEEGSTGLEPTRPNILKHATRYLPVSAFDRKASRYDHVLYNIGNSEFHTDTILNALGAPANAVVHDTRLNGIFDYMANHKIITRDRREYEDLLDKVLKTTDTRCLVSIVTNQKAIFCHSDFAKKGISKIVDGDIDAKKLMLPTGVPAVKLPKPPIPVVSFAGIISETKGIHLVERVSQLNTVMVKIFGFGVLGDSPLLKNLNPNVTVLKDLTDKDFQDYLRQSDILVNYRVSYQGETSLSTLEAMRYGVAIIVNDTGWYSELPDEAVVKVGSESEVLDAVQNLIDNPDRRAAISRSAREYVYANHSHLQYAKALSERIK